MNKKVDIIIDWHNSTIKLTTNEKEFEEFIEDFFEFTQELFEHTEPLSEINEKDIN